MTAAFARALLSLAACCLGESRSDWARAMQGELEAATEDGRALGFAFGCLLAAWREMPAQDEGRFALANHVFALGLLIPMAVLQLECLAGSPYLSLGSGGLAAMVPGGSSRSPYLAEAYSSAAPVILALWTLLGAGHLRLAWLLLERDWARVVRTGSLIVAASATLVVFTVVLFLDDAGVRLQAALLAIELIAIYALAQWESRLFARRSAPNPSR